MKKRAVVAGFILFLLNPITIYSQPSQPEKNKDELVILWTTGEKEVFTKMLYIYVLNAKKQNWFENVTLIIWGPSAKLTAEDEEIQHKIQEFKDAGIQLEACIWCTNQYKVTEQIKALDVDVKGMGTPLTEYIKSVNKNVLVF